MGKGSKRQRRKENKKKAGSTAPADRIAGQIALPANNAILCQLGTPSLRTSSSSSKQLFTIIKKKIPSLSLLLTCFFLKSRS